MKLDNDGVQGTSNEIDKSTPPTLAGTGLYDYCFVTLLGDGALGLRAPRELG